MTTHPDRRTAAADKAAKARAVLGILAGALRRAGLAFPIVTRQSTLTAASHMLAGKSSSYRVCYKSRLGRDCAVSRAVMLGDPAVRTPPAGGHRCKTQQAS